MTLEKPPDDGKPDQTEPGLMSDVNKNQTNKPTSPKKPDGKVKVAEV